MSPTPPPGSVGGLGRRTVQRSSGVWLLDFTLGGRPWRFATREVSVLSREAGQAVVYRAGLSGLDFTLQAETASVQVRAADPHAWAKSRRSLGPLAGRPFRLWRWYEGLLEDGLLALQGTVEAAGWGDSGDPSALSLTLRRDLQGLSFPVPDPQARVDSSTWPVRPLYPTDENVQGAAYPVIIGFPGSQGSLSSTAAPRPTTPGLLVEGLAHPTSVLLVADRRVHATTVRVWDISATPPESEDRTVQYTEDKLGREIAYVDFVASSFTAPAAEGHEYLVAWDRRPAYGGGILWDGEPVRGLGDLLLWGAATLSRARYDTAEMEARRAALNRHTIDTVINDPTLWEDWLRGNILDLYELEPVHSPRGLYYRQRVYVTDPTKVRARLTASPGGSGWRVVRQGPVQDVQDEIVNEITVEYDPAAMSSSSFRRRVTVGPIQGAYERGTVDTRHGAALACRVSRTLYELRPRTWQTVTTSDPSAALLLAQLKAQRHALPAQLVRYRGGPELADLRHYDTVEIEDTSPGAWFRGDLALVWDLVLEDRDTFAVTLRVPMDPLRSPTFATDT